MVADVTDFRLSESVWSLVVLFYVLLFRHIPEILFKLSRCFYNGLLLRTLHVVRGFVVGAVSALRRGLRGCRSIIVIPLAIVALAFVRCDRMVRHVMARTRFRQNGHWLCVLRLRTFKLNGSEFISGLFGFDCVVVPIWIVSEHSLRLLGWLYLDDCPVVHSIHLSLGLGLLLPLDVVQTDSSCILHVIEFW